MQFSSVAAFVLVVIMMIKNLLIDSLLTPIVESTYLVVVVACLNSWYHYQLYFLKKSPNFCVKIYSFGLPFTFGLGLGTWFRLFRSYI